jgi:hypothetical protein
MLWFAEHFGILFSATTMLENDASLKISSREYIEDTSNTDAEAYAWTSIPA